MASLNPALRRDVEVIGLVSVAHMFSHFFQLVLPPLFPLIKAEFDVSYAALGLTVTVLYGASGLAQTPAGFLVDRIGARKVLTGGLALLSLAIAVAGFVPSFWMLIPIAAIAGIGNSVFHPADFAILNGSVGPSRLGRAYSVHSLTGNVGWILAPFTMVAFSAVWGWRGALMAVGLLGLVMAALLWHRSEVLSEELPAAARRRASDSGAAGRLLITPVILACFGYFVFLAMAAVGLQSFSVSAMTAVFGVPIAVATGALTAFLVGSVVGIVAGGILADRTRRHDIVAGSGLLAGAIMMFAVATSHLGPAGLVAFVAVAGFCIGATMPSRDMLVRAATPAGSSGKVFGFVYSGLDMGAAISPVVFGLLIDLGEPRVIFYALGAFLLCAIATVVQLSLRAPAAAQT